VTTSMTSAPVVERELPRTNEHTLKHKVTLDVAKSHETISWFID
jgi:hypothetical protein